jgi:WhiB family transcriptional regulator, redox-sensing transcriptional regulator
MDKENTKQYNENFNQELRKSQLDKLCRLTMALIARAGGQLFTLTEVSTNEFNHCNQGMRDLVKSNFESIQAVLISEGYRLVVVTPEYRKVYWKVVEFGTEYDIDSLGAEAEELIKGQASPEQLGLLAKFSFSRESWMGSAACRGVQTEIFYPATVEDAALAKSVCLTCPVRQDCLEYALKVREANGVWGGLTEQERRSVKRSRRRLILG